MSVFAGKPWLRHYDFWVPATANFPRQPLYFILQTAASQFRNRPATMYEGLTMTFGEMKERADRLAASLHAFGIRKGDRIGIMLPNCPQYPVAFFAAMRLGAIVANINPHYTRPELEAVAADAGISVLVTAAPSGLTLDLEILRDGNFEELIAAGDPRSLPRVAIDAEEDVALLQYTGGTTGVSKAAMLTHYNLFANVVQNALWHSYHTRRGEERILMVLPLFHIYGQVVGLLLSTWNGTMAILIPKYDVNQVIAACREYEPTFFPGVPTLFISLLNHPESRHCGLEKVKSFNSGAAPLPVEVIEQFEQMSGAMLREGYGMTETSCTASTTPQLAARKIGSIGIPVTSTLFKIVDVDDPARELGIGEEGELCVQGPQIMKGYWNNAAETAHALRDGWMLTGDIARMDADGFFYIVQRKKDMIIVSGFKVFPNEVEDVLFTHPSVQEACVTGKPHAYRGETVKAFVVLKPHARPEPEALIAHCAARLVKYKVPTEIEFLPALPKTAVGKILRRQLREKELIQP
jgi:long-chain acyl-CoA synthetase